MSGIGTERGEHLVALGVGPSLSSVSSSWLRRNVAHAASGGSAGAPSAFAIGRASLAGQRHVGRLHRQEVEQQVQLVAVLVAEEAALLVGRQVDLAEQDGLAAAPAEEGPQVAQVVVRVELHRLADAVELEQERDGVDAEAREIPGPARSR